jgi:hypothetical protein
VGQLGQEEEEEEEEERLRQLWWWWWWWWWRSGGRVLLEKGQEEECAPVISQLSNNNVRKLQFWSMCLFFILFLNKGKMKGLAPPFSHESLQDPSGMGKQSVSSIEKQVHVHDPAKPPWQILFPSFFFFPRSHYFLLYSLVASIRLFI